MGLLDGLLGNATSADNAQVEKDLSRIRGDAIFEVQIALAHYVTN